VIDKPEAVRVGDLISLSPVTPVVSLADVEDIRRNLAAGDDSASALAGLLAHYCLDDADTRAAFEVMVSGLARPAELGDAFHVQGVYGTGKSHLLAALTLLCGHPEQSWPVFLETHPEYAEVAASFGGPRLVVAIALDEYPTRTHTLEYVVLHRIEQELAQRHGVRVALTEESHLLELVDRYVAPQVGEGLEEAARGATGRNWGELRAGEPERAAAVALDFIAETGFPLDWRRSRAAAWRTLARTLAERNGTRSARDSARSERGLARKERGFPETARGPEGVVVLLDELGLFLSAKDRAGLNADASFLQWLAQRTATSRCWVICATQRGLDEVGDIDRRTLRQLRDRFRSGFTLDLAEFEWVVRHKVAPRRDTAEFAEAVEKVAAGYAEGAGEELVSGPELARTYPVNPLCLKAVRRAAEACLSRTRSAVKLLAEAAREGRWLEMPADRLITPDVAFDVFRGEMAMSAAGRKQLHVFEVVMANAERIARGRERELAVVIKTLCLLALGELWWSEREVRASLVGCSEEALWREPGMLRELLQALHRRGAYVERVRREDEGGDRFYVDASSDASERIRQRLSELVAELEPEDSRVLLAALGACREPTFPIAAMAEATTLAVQWLNARRFVSATCRDLREVRPDELLNRAGALGSPLTKEDAYLFLASPLIDPEAQREAWLEAGKGAGHRFSASLAAWFPGALSGEAREHLVEHAALTSMVTDKTLSRRGGEFREKLRERWAASEEEVRRVIQRAYYEGEVLGADGREVIVRERLWGLFGDWEGTLAEVLAEPFRHLFPRFEWIAPNRPLSGRVHVNQIVDQFIRPGEVTLPPASALEAHLHAYATPLGLVEAEDRHLRLALKKSELVEAALEAVPVRSGGDQIDPGETIEYGELVGRLAKGEWGLTREQGELLVAALIRTGHLVGLDAFLEPVLLEQVAAPLGDSLPYVMRGRSLEGEAAEAVVSLWEAASGGAVEEWSLPAQERAWGFFVAWARRLGEGSAGNADAITRAAAALEHEPEVWDWAREALGCAEAVARAVDPRQSSREGLAAVAAAAERLPGGIQQTRERVADWRAFEQFVDEGLESAARLRELVGKAAVTGGGLRRPFVQTQGKLATEATKRGDGRRPFAKAQGKLAPAEQGGVMLAREREAVVARFGDSREVVLSAGAVRAAAEGWLERYRKHYLAWHGRVHAAARFGPLLELRRSAEMEAMRRLARAGLRTEEAEAIEAEVGAAVGRRCLAGDPLPAGEVVCPICRVEFKEEVELPEAGEVGERVAGVVGRQLEGLREQGEMLGRRLAGVGDGRVREGVEGLVEVLVEGCGRRSPSPAGRDGRRPFAEAQGKLAPAEQMNGGTLRELLADEVVGWLREQLGQPRARRREVADLVGRLRGKELARQEVLRIVAEWLGEEEGFVEVV